MDHNDLIQSLLKLKHGKSPALAELVNEEESISIHYPVYTHTHFEIHYSEKGKAWYLNSKSELAVNNVPVQKDKQILLSNNSKITFISRLNTGNNTQLITYYFRAYNIKSNKSYKSYKQLITEALEKNGSMSLGEIYKYFENIYNFSNQESLSWKNSIRHNLSINKEFTKVSDEKGSEWTLCKEEQQKKIFIRGSKESSFPNTGIALTNARLLNNTPLNRRTVWDSTDSNPKRIRLTSLPLARNKDFVDSDVSQISFEVSDSYDMTDVHLHEEMSEDEMSSLTWKSRRNKKYK